MYFDEEIYYFYRIDNNSETWEWNIYVFYVIIAAFWRSNRSVMILIKI